MTIFLDIFEQSWFHKKFWFAEKIPIIFTVGKTDSNFDFLYSFYELWMVSPDVNSIKGQLTLPLINCFLQKQCVILHLSYIWNFQKFHKDCTYFLSYLIKKHRLWFHEISLQISYVCQTQCVEISGFFCHSDFTWNQLSKIISSKTAVLDIFGALNFIQFVNLSL